MSDASRSFIGELPLPPGARYVLDTALAGDVVRRYLDALPTADEPAIAATLAADVERIGPYNDVYRGRDAYAQFLASTIAGLAGYELSIARIKAAGSVVVVEPSERLTIRRTPPHRRGGRVRCCDALIARCRVSSASEHQGDRVAAATSVDL
jgi:limonene-1,2-epoxide hydrolase